MIDRIRHFFDNLFGGLGTQQILIGAAGLIIVVVIALFFLRTPEPEIDTATIELTFDAAELERQLGAQAAATQIALTPEEFQLTEVAPTLSLSGRREVRQYAVTAFATSQRDEVEYAAVQIAGPRNAEDCGFTPNAWASGFNTEVATVTALFAELVTPTGVIIHQPANPGFISEVTIQDQRNELHVVYSNDFPTAVQRCPYSLVIPIDDADFVGSTIIITVDQTANASGGPSQIDAVELLGIQFQ